METNDKPVPNEEVIIKRQYISLFVAFILFFLAGLISVKVFGVIKYSVLGVCIPMLYLGASSIKNRVSIARFKGQKDYSRGARAVAFGVMAIVSSLIYIVIVFTPSLSNIFLPF